jgi:hypothetical protein
VVASPVVAAIAAAAASRFCLLRSFLGAAGFLSSAAELSTFFSVLGASGVFSISWLTGSAGFCSATSSFFFSTFSFFFNFALSFAACFLASSSTCFCFSAYSFFLSMIY